MTLPNISIIKAVFISKNIQDYIISYLQPLESFGINKVYSDKSRKKIIISSIKIQRFYKRYYLRNLHQECTRETILKFYITRYDIANLQAIPQKFFKKYGIYQNSRMYHTLTTQQKTYFDNFPVSYTHTPRKFYQFANLFLTSKNIIYDFEN